MNDRRRGVIFDQFQTQRKTAAAAEISFDVEEFGHATSDNPENEQPWYNNARIVFEVPCGYDQQPDLRESARHKALTLDELFGSISMQFADNEGLRLKNAETLIKVARHMLRSHRYQSLGKDRQTATAARQQKRFLAVSDSFWHFQSTTRRSKTDEQYAVEAAYTNSAYVQDLRFEITSGGKLGDLIADVEPN